MKRVITYGTFDLFHQGHFNILKRAKEYGDYLIVGVTGENYDAERGKLSVHDSLSKRIENVRKTGFADQIIVEEYLGQKISDIIKYDIDVLIVGSDWKGKFDHLRQYCEVVYLERTKDISSTQIRQDKFRVYQFGIMTDDLSDNDAIIESKCVSGIHAESVYAKDKELAEEFAKKYELYAGYDNFELFLNSVDIIYCKAFLENGKVLIEKAIKSGKHIIYDAPLNIDAVELKNLVELAKKNDVFLLANIPMIYLQSFNKLLWMLKTKEIGNIVRIKCSLSKTNFHGMNSRKVEELGFYSVYAITKLMGNEKHVDCYCRKIQHKDEISYCIFNISYESSIACIEIGMDCELEDGLSILGTEGIIVVPEAWWDLGYFKLKKKDSDRYKRYSYNFEGNGFRYIIRALLQLIRKETSSIQQITKDELQEVFSILEKMAATEKEYKE